jgi:TetR/AcrR family transcriptional repressor of bet genes
VSQASGERVVVSEHGGGGSRIRQRQRQRLIDACISALHIYGPSRTTVEKVVALADLSPGIVRFYFDSKAAMLVASLEHLAAEFGERVLVPVERLKDTPAQALRLLVNLYLDADLASPRKVSVWYAFWGEASARQEYQDICGKKDEEFAALVRELMARMIALSGANHLDADAVALGLIGVLEVLWQGIAFQSEANVDRPAAVARSLRYLHSIFPGHFNEAAGIAAPDTGSAALGADRLPPHAYRDQALLTAEREQLLRPAWQVLGHDSELRAAGDYLSGEVAGERVLVVRAERGRLHAFRNACRRRPHALVSARRGHFKSAIHCAAHSLTYSFDGRLVAGATPGDLAPLPLRRAGRLLLVRAAGAAPAAADAGVDESVWEAFAALVPRTVTERHVAADWKLVVEHWLDALLPQQRFVAPNQLLELEGGRASILQVTPTAPGESRLRRFEFSTGREGGGRARRASGRGRPDAWLKGQIALAESTQAGLQGAAEAALETGPVDPALAQFRAQIAAVMHALRPEPGGR